MEPGCSISTITGSVKRDAFSSISITSARWSGNSLRSRIGGFFIQEQATSKRSMGRLIARVPPWHRIMRTVHEILAAVGAVCKGEDIQRPATGSTGGLSSAATMLSKKP
jgi:hypothetical protein